MAHVLPPGCASGTHAQIAGGNINDVDNLNQLENYLASVQLIRQ